MTVVNPKSISGINSITTGSGSDDILTIHNNNGTERLRIESTGTTKITTGIVTTLTATSSAKVGSGVTLSPDGDVFATGVCTATSFVGSGANLTGITGTTINNNADNRVITGSGTANTLEGESGLTYNGTRLDVTTGDLQVIGGEGGDAEIRIVADQGDDGSDYWRFQSAASNNKLKLASYASGSWVDKVNVDTSGNLEVVGGNLVIGTSGNGIDFSATSDTSNGTMSSELLDDYEEGTWTPSVTMSGGDQSLGYAFRYGTYTKIGRKVHVEAYVKLNAVSNNGTGYMKLVGFPFNSINSSTYGGMHCPYYNSLNNQVMRGALIERNDNFAFVYYDFEGSAAGGTIQNATIAALFTTTSQFVLVGSYQTP